MVDGPTPGIVWSRRAHRDRVRGGGLETLGLGRSEPPVAGPGVGVGQGRRPAPHCRPGGRGDPEYFPGRPTRRVLEQLAELRKAELDEPKEALANLRLLGHEGHRKAGGLAQLRSLERVASRRAVAHPHLGEAPSIGRIGLRAGEPALGKVLRRERVDHGERDCLAAQVRCDRHPVMARRLHRHERHELRLSLEPGVERGEPSPALADPEDLSVSPGHPVPTPGDRMSASTDVDPDRRHRAASFRRPQGYPLTPVDVS